MDSGRTSDWPEMIRRHGTVTRHNDKMQAWGLCRCCEMFTLALCVTFNLSLDREAAAYWIVFPHCSVGPCVLLGNVSALPSVLEGNRRMGIDRGMTRPTPPCVGLSCIQPGVSPFSLPARKKRGPVGREKRPVPQDSPNLTCPAVRPQDAKVPWARHRFANQRLTSGVWWRPG